MYVTLPRAIEQSIYFSSLQKIGVNSEGYSTMNTGQVISSRHNCSLHSIFLQTQRLPGYGQLGNVVSVYRCAVVSESIVPNSRSV